MKTCICTALAPAFCFLSAIRGPAASANGQSASRPQDEVREFDIFVKGKPAGKSTLRIVDADDGLTRVVTEVNVKLDYLVYVYRYEFRGQETWRGDRLLATDNRSVDDGRKLAARAHVDENGSRFECNGRRSAGPPIDMTTNYWRAPLAPGRRLLLMNADRGTIYSVLAERVGEEPLTIGRQRIDCTHYRIRGETEAELWFDGQNRIVRQKSIEDGYPTELRLTRVSRHQPVAARRN